MPISPPTGRPPRPEPPLTTAEVAALMGVTVDTVQRWIQNGFIKAHKLGSHVQARYRIPRSELSKLGLEG